MIRVLIADDSAFMRMVLSNLFNGQPDFEVVDIAMNGKDAIGKILKLKPDLLTMDVNMPVLDGLAALEIIMKDCPLPVIMLSSLTQEGTDATIRALELGAVDFISKTGDSISKIDTIENEILEKYRAAAKANISFSRSRQNMPVQPIQSPDAFHGFKRVAMPERRGYRFDTGSLKGSHVGEVKKQTGKQIIRHIPNEANASSVNNRLVAIGTSTGGPKALQSLVTKLPGDLPCGVVIVQHMPAGFTKSLADRLNNISEIAVKEAENHDIIKAGQVYIAPGNYHMTIVNKHGIREIQLDQTPPVGNHRPAVDVLFKSVVPFGHEVVAVILTGMGCDGSAGMKQIKAAGGYIIAEDESTAVVYGMPKVVVDMGIADEVLPLPDIANAIVHAVKR